MIKNKKSTSYKHRLPKITNKKSSKIRNKSQFMKKNNISPSFQITNFDTSNFIKSPAPVTPHMYNSNEYPYKLNIEQEPGAYYNEKHNKSRYANIDDENYENTDIYDGNEDGNEDEDEINEDGNEDEDDINEDNVNDSYATLIKNKDMRIFKMKIILEEKRKQMFEKEREVRELYQNNSFLQSVIHDYENYNKTILEEKKKQKIAIKIISDHIRDISQEIKDDEYKLGSVKNDHYMLLKELKTIQNELKEALSLNGHNNEYVSSDEQIYDYNSDYDSDSKSEHNSYLYSDE